MLNLLHKAYVIDASKYLGKSLKKQCKKTLLWAP